jgi:hypothetical protein
MYLVSNGAPVSYPHLYLILCILLSVVRHILVEGDMSKYGAPICTRPAFGRITYFGALVFCPHINSIKLSVGEGMLIEGLLVIVLLPYPIPTCILSNCQ